MAYLFSLIYVLNSSLTIVKMQQSQYEGIGKYGNIHDNSIIYYHINLLKSRNKSELLLDSDLYLSEHNECKSTVEKLFTFKHLDCLHEYSMIL